MTKKFDQHSRTYLWWGGYAFAVSLMAPSKLWSALTEQYALRGTINSDLRVASKSLRKATIKNSSDPGYPTDPLKLRPTPNFFLPIWPCNPRGSTNIVGYCLILRPCTCASPHLRIPKLYKNLHTKKRSSRPTDPFPRWACNRDQSNFFIVA